jgi:hypothetical protein
MKRNEKIKKVFTSGLVAGKQWLVFPTRKAALVAGSLATVQVVAAHNGGYMARRWDAEDSLQPLHCKGGHS